jgi:hypothetical protein
MTGRHSTGVSSTRTRKVAPVVAGCLAVAAIVSAVVAWFVAVPGSGAPTSRSVAGAAGASASAGQPNTASSAPVAQVSRGATRSPEAVAIQGHGDPFGTAAVHPDRYRAGRGL